MLTIGNIQRKDMSNMSFVGIHNTNAGLIAFADSRATLLLENGQKTEDSNRSPMQKIFKNRHFICVNYGNNELFSVRNKQRMEDFIKNNLEELTYKQFFQILYSRLLADEPEYNDGYYRFIIGSKDMDGYFVRALKIDILHKKLHYSKKEYRKQAYYAGDERYVRMYDLVKKYNDIPTEKYREHIKKQIEHMISIWDYEYEYNTVGLPVCTDIYQ